MQRIEVVREVDRADRLIEELGEFIAYGNSISEELEQALDGYDLPKEALDNLYQRRHSLTELLRENPAQEEFDIQSTDY